MDAAGWPSEHALCKPSFYRYREKKIVKISQISKLTLYTEGVTGDLTIILLIFVWKLF